MSPACVSDETGTALAVSVNTASVHTEEHPPCKVWCQKLAGKQQVGMETSGSSITLSYLPLQAYFIASSPGCLLPSLCWQEQQEEKQCLAECHQQRKHCLSQHEITLIVCNHQLWTEAVMRCPHSHCCDPHVLKLLYICHWSHWVGRKAQSLSQRKGRWACWKGSQTATRLSSRQDCTNHSAFLTKMQ